jgi:hypothetical protein
MIPSLQFSGEHHNVWADRIIRYTRGGTYIAVILL